MVYGMGGWVVWVEGAPDFLEIRTRQSLVNLGIWPRRQINYSPGSNSLFLSVDLALGKIKVPRDIELKVLRRERFQLNLSRCTV